MRVRLTIAVLTGAVVGLAVLTWILAARLTEARRQLEAASALPELPASTNQRPMRLRLHALPPINIRTEVKTLDWNSIESEDYATYIQNLRNIGCPEETIRDIIVADVDKLFASRRRSIELPQPDWMFWRHPDEIPPDDAAAKAEKEHAMELARLERERRQLLQSLLGDSAAQATLAEYTAEASVDRDLRFLSPEKRQAMAEATARWRLAQEAAISVAGSESAEVDNALAAAAQDLKQAIGKILNPQEQLEYELRSSPLAEELRDRLRGFGASREEFQKLFELERDFFAERERLETAVRLEADPQAAEKLEATVIEHEEGVQKLLGNQRFADLQRTSDPDYQTLYSLAKDHAVPTDLANQVWGMRREVENQTTRIRDNPFLSADQKTRALAAIRNETQAAIVDVLGEPLLNDYQRQGGGWLIDLTEPTDLGETDRPIVPPPLPGIENAQPGPVLLQPFP